MIVVMMGVSGSGKSLIGSTLATRLGITFADADDFHPAANKQKMATGNPLTDEDRQPWLERLNRLLADWSVSHQSGVLACSALKEQYRETLRSGIPPAEIHFVWLDASPKLVAERLVQRHHEYMSPNLLASQFATLEPPSDALRIVNDKEPALVVDEITQALRSVSN